MSKADQLGSGRFGGGVRSVSARRQAVAAATGVPTEGIAPPTELPVHRISLNPDNPRSSLGDLTDLAGSLGTHGQKQAITVMNRDAYVKANPDCESALEPDTTHVVIDGSSRLAAAREAGLDTVKVMVSDDQGTTSEEILESALIANIHRQELAELDEARALQRLQAIYGSQRALAKRLHRSQGWVSQRLALLNLTPELQARVGEEPIDLLRAIGNRPADEQAAALEALKAERVRAGAAAQAVQPHETESAPADGASGSALGDYGVITEAGVMAVPDQAVPDGAAASPVSVGVDYAVITGPETDSDPGGDAARPASVPASKESIPEPRTDSVTPTTDKDAEARNQQVGKLPYEEPGSLAMLLDQKIDRDDAFFALLEHLAMKAVQRDPERLAQLAQTLSAQAATPAH